MTITAATIDAVALIGGGMVAIVGFLAYRLGWSAGFDAGVKAARQVDRSVARDSSTGRAR